MTAQPRQECLRCAYPLDSQRSVLNILSHVQDMLQHVGYTVDRFVVDQTNGISVSFDLRRSSKRRNSNAPSEERPSKRQTESCARCVSSCCSTKSLCKANACSHKNEEESSRPLSSSPPPDMLEPKSQQNPINSSNTPLSAPQSHHHHHHHHVQTKRHHHHRHRPRSSQGPSAPPQQTQLVPPSEAHQRHIFLQNESMVPDPTPDVLQSATFSQPDRHIAQHSIPEHHVESGDVVAAAVAAATAADVNLRVQKRAKEVADRENTAWTATTAPAGFDASRERLLSVAPFVSTPVSASLQRAAMHVLKSPQPNDIRTFTQQTVKTKNTASDLVMARREPDDLNCNPCNLKFTTELELRKHQFNEHKDETKITKTPEGRFLCLLHSCTQSFVRRHVMERHFKTVHLHVKAFQCNACDKAFADSSTRDAHQTAVHEKKKPWVCSHCSSAFTQSSSLGKHRRRFHRDTAHTTPQK